MSSSRNRGPRSAMARTSLKVPAREGPSSAKELLEKIMPNTPAPTKQERPTGENLFGSCHLCEWKGYITYPGDDYADIKRCSCQDETCPQCYGAGGFEVELPSGNRAWKTCGCQQLERRMKLFRSAEIPARFATKTLNAFAPNEESQMRVRTFLYKLFQDTKANPAFRPGDAGAVFMGPPGVGKTHLMVALIRNLILERGVACRFQDFGILLSRLRDAYSREVSEMKILEPLSKVDVLLLDDLAKGRNSKWELGIIDTLISCRYNAGRTTLVTTNYTDLPETTLRERSRGRGFNEGEEILFRDTLQERVGDRIYSRLREMCRFFYIKGPDHRQKLLR